MQTNVKPMYRVKIYKCKVGIHKGRWVWECSHFPFMYSMAGGYNYDGILRAALSHLKSHYAMETVELPEEISNDTC